MFSRKLSHLCLCKGQLDELFLKGISYKIIATHNKQQEQFECIAYTFTFTFIFHKKRSGGGVDVYLQAEGIRNYKGIPTRR